MCVKHVEGQGIDGSLEPLCCLLRSTDQIDVVQVDNTIPTGREGERGMLGRHGKEGGWRGRKEGGRESRPATIMIHLTTDLPSNDQGNTKIFEVIARYQDAHLVTELLIL